jgi:hypothetical protein
MTAIHSLERVLLVESWISGWIILVIFICFLVMDIIEVLEK